MLWSGLVADQSRQEVHIQCIRELNKKIHHDDRVNASLLSVDDGINLVFKK